MLQTVNIRVFVSLRFNNGAKWDLLHSEKIDIEKAECVASEVKGEETSPHLFTSVIIREQSPTHANHSHCILPLDLEFEILRALARVNLMCPMKAYVTRIFLLILDGQRRVLRRAVPTLYTSEGLEPFVDICHERVFGTLLD